MPVVIVSIAADRNRGSSLGASQVLQKPVSSEELAAVGFPADADGGRRTLLVVDDDPKAVQLIGAYLDLAGYRVLSAFGGQECIEMARRQHLDLIVLDLMMPEVNGFDVVEALKRDAATAIIPIVVVTSKQITAEDRIRHAVRGGVFIIWLNLDLVKKSAASSLPTLLGRLVVFSSIHNIPSSGWLLVYLYLAKLTNLAVILFLCINRGLVMLRLSLLGFISVVSIVSVCR